MVKSTAEILEEDTEEDMAAFFLDECGVDYSTYNFDNKRILTREVFEQHIDKIVKIINKYPDSHRPIAYIILGCFILTSGSKLSEKLKAKILESCNWAYIDSQAYEHFKRERQFYIEDFRQKIVNHRAGKSSYLVQLKNSKDLDFTNGVIGLNNFWDFVESKKISYIKHINLDACELTTIPHPILKLKYFETLSLDHNYLTSIPEELSNMTYLECLYMDYNCITKIHPSIRKLSNLKYLCVNNNNLELKSIPKSMLDLHSLKRFSIRGNKLENIPRFLESADFSVNFEDF